MTGAPSIRNPFHISFRIAAVIALILILFAPYWTKQGLLFVIGVTLIQATFALTWNLLYGYTGMTTFGHAAFYAIGAYTIGAVLKHNLEVPYLLAMALAGAIGAAAALIVGWLVLRRSSGIYLAILTMALSELLYQGITHSAFLGHEDGLASLQRPTVDFLVFQVNLREGFNMYYFLLITCALVTAVIWRLAHSRFGRVLRAIKQDSERASFVGINVFRYRLAAFSISGGLAALVGTLHTPWLQLVSPEVSSWLTSTQPLLNTLVGGANSFWGPVIGAFVFAGVNLATHNFIGLSEVVMGVVLLVIILLAPNGVIGILGTISQRFARKPKQGAIGEADAAH